MNSFQLKKKTYLTIIENEFRGENKKS